MSSDPRAEAFRRAMEATLAQMERELFSTRARGPRPAFSERDFGKWGGKIRGTRAERVYFDEHGPPEGWTHFELPPEMVEPEAPSRTKYSSFKDAGKEKRPERIFASRAYRLVSEEPPVAVAAVELRAAIEAERRHFWKVGSDGMRVYRDAFFREGVPARLERAERQLRRRIKAALAEGPEPGLW